MLNKLPDLTVTHHRIENPNSPIWNLTPFAFLNGAKVDRQSHDWLSKVIKLPFLEERIGTIEALKEHVIGLLDSGSSHHSIKSYLYCLKYFFTFSDDNHKPINTPKAIQRALYDFTEFQFQQASLKKIKPTSAYMLVKSASHFINSAIEGVNFEIKHTRLRTKSRTTRAINREAEKMHFSHAEKLAKFCFSITQNFKPESLISGNLPIIITLTNKPSKEYINLTPQQKNSTVVDKNFIQTHAAQAFNNRVTSELIIFLGMTMQNITPTLNLARDKFDYKPLGDQYEIREYKNRRGGEVLFKIPNQYRPYFEQYLHFLDKYAPESQWLFPFLKKGTGFVKRATHDISPFKNICKRHHIPWIAPKEFRKTGENILMRLCSDEQTAADYANHGIAVFRQSYEFPSIQRAMIEIGRFWNENDPLTHGCPKVSLFNTPCNGIPLPIENSTDKLPKPDCITPTGCIGCKHYRDEESFDYVWNLHTFKYLKIIESSSHRTEELKPSNIVIDWTNLKIEWFKNSNNPKHKEWVNEAKTRIEEDYYHPHWARRIDKYKG